MNWLKNYIFTYQKLKTPIGEMGMHPYNVYPGRIRLALFKLLLNSLAITAVCCQNHNNTNLTPSNHQL